MAKINFTRIKVILVLILIILATPLCYIFIYHAVTGSDFYRYMKASKLYVAGDYDASACEYEKISEYRDSKVKAYNIRYALGKYHLDNGNYLKALEEFKLAGPDAYNDYNYTLAMYCFDNESYENAAAFFEAANLYDYEEMKNRSVLLSAVKSLKAFDFDRMHEYMDVLPEGYTYNGYSADLINAFVDDNEQWLTDQKKWQFESGVAGAYELKELIYEGWKTDVGEFRDNISLDFVREVDDELQLWLTLSARIPYYATFSKDMDLQSKFLSYRDINKKFKAEDMAFQIDIDDETMVVIGDDKCVIKYRSEEDRQLPEENLPIELKSICESEVTFTVVD